MEQHLEAKSERLSTMSSSSPAEALGVFVLSRSASLKNSSLLGFTGAIVGPLLKQDDSYFPIMCNGLRNMHQSQETFVE